MPEGSAYSQDTKNITAAAGAASEALTARDILCESVLLIPVAANVGDVYTVDPADDTNTIPIPASGVTLPISNPASIKVAADNSGDDVYWYAV